jgi:HEAT repeat protein
MRTGRCRRSASLVPFLTAALAVPVAAQEVRLTNGEVIAGAVVAVDGSRAKVRATDGTMRQVDARSIDVEVASDGSAKRHACKVAKGALPPPAAALLVRLQKGEALAPPDVAMLTGTCTDELLVALREASASKSAAVRASAVRALAATATPEGVRAALDLALGDRSGAMWREVATAIAGGAGLGAVQALDAQADVEKGLTHKDKGVRFACAAAATRLGSETARPVLAVFVGDSDHHARESAATILAECGDAAGASVLMTMCKRERAPIEDANRDADAETKAMVARVARRERIRSCELLGRLRHGGAVPVLTALAKHRDAEIAQAATKALAAIAAPAKGS